MQDTVEYVIGAPVTCADDDCGHVEFVVVDPVAEKLTHLVVRPDDGAQARLVPVHIAVAGPEGIALNCTRARFEEFEPAVQTRFLAGTEQHAAFGPGDRVLTWPFYGLAVSPALSGLAPGVDPEPELTTVEHIPVGEVSIRRGERVHAVDGEIGRVRGLVVVRPESEVSHVLLDEGHLWGRKRVAIPIRDVIGIDDDGVAVRLSKDQIKELPPVDVEGLEAQSLER
ncbi:MAG: hypothetical protein HOV87_35115 [Catenulispora sp.]|nr:hypothetical protein [Catenulispora sp.]